MLRLIQCLCALLVVATFGQAAVAQPLQPLADSRALAEKAYAEAQAAFLAGNRKKACDKLAESYSIWADLRTLVNIADCANKSDDVVGALVTYDHAGAQAETEGSDLVPLIARLRKEAERDLPTLVVRISDTANHAHCNDIGVELDGTLLPKEALGVARPTNPGPHVIVARDSGGKELWRKTEKVARRAHASVVVPGYPGFTLENVKQQIAINERLLKGLKELGEGNIVAGCQEIETGEAELQKLPPVFRCKRVVDGLATTMKDFCTFPNREAMELYLRSARMASASEKPGGALDRHEFREACDTLGQATRLHPEPEWLFQEAFCEAKLGELARAIMILERLVPLAQAGSHAELVSKAETRLQELRPEVTFVVVRADSGLRDVAIEHADGKAVIALDPAQLGKRVPVNPGVYRITGKQDKRSVGYRFEARGDGETVSFPPSRPSVGSGSSADPAPKVDPVTPPYRGCGCELANAGGSGGWMALVLIVVARVRRRSRPLARRGRWRPR
jgi:MYXO-CTERM domain-containing protein